MQNPPETVCVLSLAGILFLVCAGSVALLQHRASQREKALREKLLRVNRVREKLVGLLSHDIRNPLASMYGILRIAGADRNMTEQQILIRRQLAAQAETTLGLLDNLLFWSESQMVDIQPYPVMVDLAELARECAAQAGIQAALKDVQILVDEHSEALATADPEMIRLVLRNLITNAVKFTPEGGLVTVVLEERDGMACAEVRDTGRGMTAAQTERLFSGEGIPAASGTAGEKGAGLGIPLCRAFVAANQGHIRAESQPDKGTSVTVCLPGVE